MRRLIVSFLALAACAGPPPPVHAEQGDKTPPVLPRDQCNAAKAQFAMGKTYTPELGQQAGKAAGASVVRRLNPGEIVAMIYMIGRLNLELDTSGTIISVRCG